jgi:hypothetical protein
VGVGDSVGMNRLGQRRGAAQLVLDSDAGGLSSTVMRGGLSSTTVRASRPSPPLEQLSLVTLPLPSLLSLTPRVPAGFDLGSCLRLRSTPTRLRALGVVGTSYSFY